MELLSFINNNFNEVNEKKAREYNVSAWACPIWESCKNSGSECQMCSELNPYVPEDQNYYSFNNWQDDDEDEFGDQCTGNCTGDCSGGCSSSCGYSHSCDSSSVE